MFEAEDIVIGEDEPLDNRDHTFLQLLACLPWGIEWIAALLITNLAFTAYFGLPLQRQCHDRRFLWWKRIGKPELSQGALLLLAIGRFLPKDDSLYIKRGPRTCIANADDLLRGTSWLLSTKW